MLRWPSPLPVNRYENDDVRTVTSLLFLFPENDPFFFWRVYIDFAVSGKIEAENQKTTPFHEHATILLMISFK